jgi:hypothetical protein
MIQTASESALPLSAISTETCDKKTSMESEFFRKGLNHGRAYVIKKAIVSSTVLQIPVSLYLVAPKFCSEHVACKKKHSSVS